MSFPPSRRRARAVVAALTGSLVLSALAATAGTSTAAAEPSTAAAEPAAADPAAAAGRTLHTVTVQVPASMRTGAFTSTRQLTVPAGWTASVWTRLPGARYAALAPDRAILVSDPRHGRVVRLQPRANPASPPMSSTLVEGLAAPQGLAFDGGTLYVGQSDRVEAWTYTRGALSNRRVVVGDLPSGGHDAKGLVVGADHALYVSVGSSGNTTAADRTAARERAAIYRVPPGGGAATVFAHGVRNGAGLALDPTGAVWTAVNNRDQITYPWHRDYDGDGSDDYGTILQGYVNDHPVEEIARLTAGRDLGWPYCNPDPDVTPGDPASAFEYRRPPYVPDAELNPGGTVLDCSKLAPIERGVPAHSAPLGFHFVTGSALPTAWRGGALVALHGSWNRVPPREPSVQFLRWSGTGLAVATPMVTGFQAADGSRWGRTVDAVPGADGALYVTDDTSGTVYRLAAAA